MSIVTIPVREHLFSETIHLTKLTEYGVSWEELTAGRATLPPRGARFDIAFESTIAGPRIKGKISGVDYLTVRADGRFILDMHAILNTDDGEKISIDGLLIPLALKEKERIAQLRLNFEFTTLSTKYCWLNQTQGWGIGTVGWDTGEVEMEVYAA